MQILAQGISLDVTLSLAIQKQSMDTAQMYQEQSNN